MDGYSGVVNAFKLTNFIDGKKVNVLTLVLSFNRPIYVELMSIMTLILI